ncbi:NAD-dependent epimerase/dehydratase family protein [Roseibium aggregatum]|uniref:NAD-dependent epimerase/dehydratase family protein n=1 Tax=Roseibium aggregatum TaxID=187304 RepID=A0A939EET0_9HYPH|nr:NAD-dependent epimerase/dehydratase family protein [Roseibium aggregatum]MBN9670823.1 NAD-dependent epimerase/dehydratase family protein [Roseibium aggregatum]
MTGHVLIAGASGVIGQAACAEFASRGWRVTALSRRRPAVSAAFTHLAVDLTDPAACVAALATVGPVTHVVYAALYEEPDLVAGWRSQAQMRTNLAMLRNLLEPLLERGDRPHVSLFQGTKAYGVHIRPFPVPARERWPRHDHANFYWLQEDFIRDKSAEHRLTFTIFRPQVVFGEAVGVAMNIVPVIGAWAVMRAAEGLPFGFPGGPPYILEAVDARLIARALVWAASSERARGETFNITNGDVFVWHNVWPVIAESLGGANAPPERVVLAKDMPARADLWRKLAGRFRLAEPALDALIGHSHHYADFTFATHARKDPAPAIVSTIKLRQAGFCDCVDTEDMFRAHIAALQDANILPASEVVARIAAAGSNQETNA